MLLAFIRLGRLRDLLSGLAGPTITNWLTPVWIVCMGAAAALVLLLLLWAVVRLVRPKAGIWLYEAVAEGPLRYVMMLLYVAAAFAFVGSGIVRAPGDILASLPRLRYAGEQVLKFTIPPPADSADEEWRPIEVDLVSEEIRHMKLESQQPLSISTRADALETATDTITVNGAGEAYNWLRGEDSLRPFEADHVERLYVKNRGVRGGELTMTLDIAPPYPEVSAAVITLLGVFGLFLAYLVPRLILPKLSAVALATFKSEIVHPLFLLLLGIGFAGMMLLVIIPYNTFGEDVKVLKDTGLTIVMVFCIIEAVWAASSSVSDEIEGRTALSVLSKPVSRRQFVLGKFAGIVWTVAILFLVLGAWLLIWVAYRPLLDAREGAKYDPTWQLCHLEMVSVAPGLVLAFLETVIMAALAVAISTRLPIIPNILICFAIYVLGHLTPLLAQSSLGQFEPVNFAARFIGTVFPMLEYFNIQAAIAGGAQVPFVYLGWALVYCLLYSAVAMLLALVMFEDRDLA